MLGKLSKALILLAASSSQVAADPTRLSATPFVENVFENAEISGTLVVGLSKMTSTLTENIRINAEVPRHWEALCLTVTTIDGLYESRNDFRLPEDFQGGEVTFDYPTSHKDRLLEVGADRIGTLVQKGTCAGQSEKLALSGWRATDAQTDNFRLYVNAFQADELVAYVGNGPETRCAPLSGGSRSAFDMVCDLSLEPNSQSPIDIELIRIRSGRIEAATPVVLEW